MLQERLASSFYLNIYLSHLVFSGGCRAPFHFKCSWLSFVDFHTETEILCGWWQWLQFPSPPVGAQSSIFPPVILPVWFLHEFCFLFITLWCPAAPVNTFLQPAIHGNIMAAETPVMNFNLPFAEGASPRLRLIKGNTPFQEGGRLQTDWAQVTP